MEPTEHKAVNEKYFSSIWERYKHAFCQIRFVRIFVESFVFLFLALAVNSYCSIYAADKASNSVTDIVLSNIPVYNVDNIFVWGPIIFWVILAVFLLSDPKKIPFTIKSVALFVLIRSIFISLTHLGPFPDRVQLNTVGVQTITDMLSHSSLFIFFLNSGSDLFFSGHTGMPFLLALVFWHYKPIRYLCLITSAYFGLIVLMGHLHYSIDVMSAFFITYSIYHIGNLIFKKDREIYYGNIAVK